MSTQLPKLNDEEASAIDRIDAELKGLPSTSDVGDLCKKYHDLRASLLILVKILKKIPVFGEKAAAALEFLMSVADVLCPV